MGGAGVSEDASNTNNASSSTDNTVSYDTAKPEVTIDQAASQSDPTNAQPVHFTAVFSEHISGFTGDDVTLSGSAGHGSASATVTQLSGNRYNVAVAGLSSDGTISADIAAAGVSDDASNSNNASSSTDNTVSYDTAKPSVTIDQAAGQSDPTNAQPVHFTAVFSEHISGFTGDDVTLSGSAGHGSASAT